MTWSGLNIAVVPDGRVLLFTLGVSAAVALAFGLAPLRTVAGIPVTLALRSAAATSNTDRNRLWGRKLVVAAQISLCMVLLFAASLLYQTLRNLESRDLGMRTAGLLVFGVTPQANIRTDADAIRFHSALLERMRNLPGVDAGGQIDPGLRRIREHALCRVERSAVISQLTEFVHGRTQARASPPGKRGA